MVEGRYNENKFSLARVAVKTWEEYKDFHFNLFIHEVYEFFLSPEKQAQMKDERGQWKPEFIQAARRSFERNKLPIIRMNWQLRHQGISEKGNINAEVKDILSELDQGE